MQKSLVMTAGWVQLSICSGQAAEWAQGLLGGAAPARATVGREPGGRTAGVGLALNLGEPHSDQATTHVSTLKCPGYHFTAGDGPGHPPCVPVPAGHSLPQFSPADLATTHEAVTDMAVHSRNGLAAGRGGIPAEAQTPRPRPPARSLLSQPPAGLQGEATASASSSHWLQTLQQGQCKRGAPVSEPPGT